jgi:hypothetical protein
VVNGEAPQGEEGGPERLIDGDVVIVDLVLSEGALCLRQIATDVFSGDELASEHRLVLPLSSIATREALANQSFGIAEKPRDVEVEKRGVAGVEMRIAGLLEFESSRGHQHVEQCLAPHWVTPCFSVGLGKDLDPQLSDLQNPNVLRESDVPMADLDEAVSTAVVEFDQRLELGIVEFDLAASDRRLVVTYPQTFVFEDSNRRP